MYRETQKILFYTILRMFPRLKNGSLYALNPFSFYSSEWKNMQSARMCSNKYLCYEVKIKM